MSTTRRQLDQYFTPASASRELLKHINVNNCYVLECCAGDGAISNVIQTESGVAAVKTNDIDDSLGADWTADITNPEVWKTFPTGCHWVISNPPFNRAAEILPLALNYARIGIAMLLRLSYLEPCFDRAIWLSEYPPSKLIVLPRISFTNDGKTDNVTCAWMVWDKRTTAQEIIVVPRSGR